MSESQVTKKSGSAKRWLRRLAWCVAGVLGLWALLWLALPYLLRTQGEKIATEKLGRKVHIGAVEFKPWSLELTVRDLQVAAASGDVPQVSVDRIYVDADMQSLFRLAPVLDAIEIDKPVINAAQTAPGQFDFDDVLARLKDPNPKPDDGKPANFALYNIVLKDGAVAFRDDSVGQTHHLEALNLGVPFVSSIESKRTIKVVPRLDFKLNGSEFASTAETTPFTDDRKTDASFQIKALDLKPYLAYLPKSLPAQLVGGVVSADIKVAFEQSPKAAVKLSGTVQAADVVVKDAHQGDLLQWKTLDVSLADVQPLAGRVHVASIALDGADISLKRGKDGKISLLDAQGKPVDKTAKPAAADQLPDDAHDAVVAVDAVGAVDKNATEIVAKSEDVAGAEAQNASDTAAPSPAATDVAKADGPAPAAKAKTTSATPSWQVQVDSVKVSNTQGLWLDESVPVPARVQLDDFVLEASSIHWPFKEAFPFKGSAGLSGGKGVPSGGKIAFEGKATDKNADIGVTTTNLPLQLGASYLTGVIEPGVQGTIDSQTQLQWQGDAVVLNLADLAVSGVALQCNSTANCAAPHGTVVGLKGKDHLLELQKLQVKNAVVDTAKQTVRVGSIELVQPALGVSRSAAGRWMYEDWLPATKASGAVVTAKSEAKKATPAAGKGAAPAWAVQLDSIAIKGANVQYLDESLPRKAAFKVTGLDVELRDFAPLATKAKPSVLKVSGRLGTGRAEAGRLVYDGTLGLTPLSAAGRLNLTQLPVHAFEPYAAAALPVRIMRADANFKGTIDFLQSPKGPVVSVKGDAGLDDVRVRPLGAARKVAGNTPKSGATQADAAGASTNNDAESDADKAAAAPRARSAGSGAGFGALGASDDLLNWKILSLRGLDVHMAPEQRMKVKVSETALSDFYARLIIQENGKLNLQDLGPDSGEGAAAPDAKADGKAGDKSVAAAAIPAVAAPVAPAAPATGPIIDLGPITISGGTVKFSDRFIRPNYSADLSELAGRMSAFSSEPTAAGQPPALADLEVRGKAEGTASLEVTGKLNPLVKPLALSIHGKVRDLELSPLSPYSVKYAGHGIERGKMSVDVQYDVQPDGQLTAANKLVLNQLSFGDAVKGAPASLPVKLAVALLADRNGVIDVDLPISGSLNDPQFRLAPVIFKVIGNLIMKAITSPFALLSGAMSGGAEGSQVAFAAGSAVLDAPTRANLDKIAKALDDRPALQLTVSGQASAEVERDGWRKARLDDLVLAQKRRVAIRGGAKADEVQTVDKDEYANLLKDVYKRADIKKPRNMVGLATDIPPDQMETLLLTGIDMPDSAMRELALARGVAVRDYLASKGVKLERLFLGNVKTDALDKDWKPHAELSLAPR